MPRLARRSLLENDEGVVGIKGWSQSFNSREIWSRNMPQAPPLEDELKRRTRRRAQHEQMQRQALSECD